MFCNRFLFTLFLSVVLVACAPTPQVQNDKIQQAEAHYRMGVSHLQNDNPTMALQELLKGVAIAPQSDSIHAALGQAYQLKKAYVKAEEHYLKAIDISNKEPRYMNNIGSLYLDMQEWDKAIDYFGQAADDLLFLNPHVALAGKGFAYLQKKDYQAALYEFEKAAEVSNRYPRAYFLQSEALVGMGRTELARKALEKAVNLAPNYVLALYQLGVMEMKAQENDTAIDRFEKVVELAPTSDPGLKAADLLRALKSAE
ncbi:Tfp pilus assembly protein PilF [Malonomonas rubra DSM 5091]|uniref:Tfp pilus assembly protein PilF n=1 Tax=Malonomonas rubra DSM 5091 TaxID=1122189 RepID=A0A1M6DK91_MALRU|nr:tetratricopeptide repeat protein [Malonomonas rubra]SHI73551.1 Tfp pilus assembly protein PilF [Malonomonas rubra DSM 5091]